MSDSTISVSDEFMEDLAQRVATLVLEQLGVGPTLARWLTVEQAAEYLGRSPEAIRGLEKRGTIPGYRPDGRLQFDREELDAWMRGVPSNLDANHDGSYDRGNVNAPAAR